MRADSARMLHTAAQAAVLVSFFWMLDGPVAVRSVLRVVALERRPAIHALVDEMESRVGAFVRGQLFVCLISATVVPSSSP